MNRPERIDDASLVATMRELGARAQGRRRASWRLPRQMRRMRR